MKETRKNNRLIYTMFLLLPLVLIALQCFRLGTYNLSDIESAFSVFRTLDFGLSEYIIQNALNNTSNTLVLLVFDLCLYKLFFMVISFAIELFGMIFDLARMCFDKITRGLN